MFKRISTVMAGCALAVASASASLSGTLIEVHDPLVSNGPIGPYYRQYYEPLQNLVYLFSTSMEFVLAAYIYADYTDANYYLEIRLNGNIYYQSFGGIPAAKPSIPNLNLNGVIPESAFNVGSNVVEYELKVVNWEPDGHGERFYYKWNINRSNLFAELIDGKMISSSMPCNENSMRDFRINQPADSRRAYNCLR